MPSEKNPVNWFEIAVTDLNRAKEFYENILGYELSVQEMGPLKMAWFPANRDAPSAPGTLVKAEYYKPSLDGTLVYFSVEDIDATLEKIKDNGGKVLNPKMPIGNFGFIAHFIDSEGNKIGLHSES
jgi:uncharacterized protein